MFRLLKQTKWCQDVMFQTGLWCHNVTICPNYLFIYWPPTTHKTARIFPKFSRPFNEKVDSMNQRKEWNQISKYLTWLIIKKIIIFLRNCLWFRKAKTTVKLAVIPTVAIIICRIVIMSNLFAFLIVYVIVIFTCIHFLNVWFRIFHICLSKQG